MSQCARVSMLVAVFLFLAAPMAQAQEYGESLDDLALPDPGPYSPGESVSFSGDGFLPDSDVYLTLLATTDGAITDIGVVTADSAGSIAGPFVVPLVGDGTYTVSATGVTPDGATRILSGAIVVVSAEDEPEATTTTEAEVVETTGTSAATTTTTAADVEPPEAMPFEGDDDGGSNTGLILAIGLLLLLAVGGFLWWRYRASTL